MEVIHEAWNIYLVFGRCLWKSSFIRFPDPLSLGNLFISFADEVSALQRDT